MTDRDLRALERDPHTPREVLEQAWLRAGRGWHGERLPPPSEGACGGYLHPLGERGVYEWVVDEGLRMQFVFVPGGEVECEACKGRGTLPRRPTPGGHFVSVGCGACGGDLIQPGTGRRAIAPFYLGRFPVTWGEWRAFVWATKHHGPVASVERLGYHPATNISLADALAFCAWAGLRLPSAREWRWAALGAKTPSKTVCTNGHEIPPRGPGQHTNGRTVCRPCEDSGARYTVRHISGQRRYPWGNEPPSPGRCVWAGHPEFGPHGAGAMGQVWPGSTAPVVDCAACVRGDCYVAAACAARPDVPSAWKEPLVPARPEGRSWCGAHDMAGNVYELTDDGLAHGGSFRTDLRELTVTGPVREPRATVGSRVALTAG